LIFYFGTDVDEACLTGLDGGAFYFSFYFLNAAIDTTFSFNSSLKALI
jgi:hypothetical protein